MSADPGERLPLADRLRTRPLLTGIVLEVIADVIVIAGAFALAAILPTLPGYSLTGWSQSLVLVLVLAALVLLLITAFRWWGLSGFTGRAAWRDMHLYWLPVVLLFAPFVAGIHIPEPTALAYLALAYLATAVFEESLWRGVILGILRPLGVWPAVLISSLFFGLGHLSNSALRGFSVVILAQAFGAAVQGVGLAALRLRTKTIWPLIAIHALHDLFLQMGNLPIPLIEVPIDTIFLIYGIVLLRRSRRERLQAAPGTPPTRSALAAAQ
jgi:membrane protease YdiL (CAAX protease family)